LCFAEMTLQGGGGKDSHLNKGHLGKNFGHPQSRPKRGKVGETATQPASGKRHRKPRTRDRMDVGGGISRGLRPAWGLKSGRNQEGQGEEFEKSLAGTKKKKKTTKIEMYPQKRFFTLGGVRKIIGWG